MAEAKKAAVKFKQLQKEIAAENERWGSPDPEYLAPTVHYDSFNHLRS